VYLFLTSFCSFVGQVIEWSKEFHAHFSASTPFPDIKIHTLSMDGEVIGVDGKPLKKGHVDDEWHEGILPFPGCCLTVTPLPMETLKRDCDARNALDDMMIDKMLGELGLTRECAAFKLMDAGNANVKAMFARDSHREMLTHKLPSTASMKSAVYNPLEIYKTH
jgi:hypothetical protein